MKSYKYTNLTALFLMLAALPACDEREFPDGGSRPTPGGVSTSQMHPNVSSAGGFIGTKAGNGPGEPVNVYGSEDDGLMITEYVSDLNGIAPMTRGTEITTARINSNNKSFGLLGYYEVTETPVTQPIAAKGLDIDGSCSFSSTWGWDAATTQYTTTYHTPGVPTNAMTPINGTPKWRINSTERIWSIYPASSTARIPFNAEGEQDDLKSAIDPESPSSFNFKYTVSTTLENQEDLIFAYNKETRKWKKAGTAPDPNAWVWDDGTNTSFDIKFYHAMAAVKFELSNAATVPDGTNVHSITLCYMDASKNIVQNVGVARYGECEVTGDDTSTGSRGVSFNWNPSKLSTYKPLHYTYADTYSATPSTSTVAGGYASTGNGVMFMIPQTIPHTISTAGGTATLKIIVEFSRYGSSEYHAVVKDFTSGDVTWNAGNYYLYQLSIGEFHVPGELMSLSNVWFSGLKTATGTTGFLQPDSPMPTKGVSKVGLVIDGYGLGKKADQYVYLGGVKDGVDQLPVSNSGGVQTPTNAATSFTYSFAGVSAAPVPNTGGQVYEFGLDGTTETYYSYYRFSNTLNGTEQIGDVKVNIKDIQDIFLTEETEYYVFDTTGADKFQVIFKPSAGSNDGGFKAKIRCMIILEIIKDANLPGNWDDFLANLSDYL